jgi:RHS repeat-associated protein
VRGLQEALVPSTTGGASLGLSLGLPAGRDGFAPSLALSYTSTGGAGAFGLGWDLGLVAVRLRTERGVPRYDGADEVLLGDQPLVRERDDSGGVRTRERTVHGLAYRITRYRPRVESAYDLIEHWERTDDATDVRWRVLTGAGICTWFGRDDESRVADPADRRRIAVWLPCFAHDDRGNVVRYRYRAEDSTGVDAGSPPEAARTPASRSAARHLARVGYGNRTPYHPGASEAAEAPEPGDDELLFHLVVDHGDHDLETPGLDPDADWPVRPDVQTSHRTGFEVRSYRRGRRLLVFHAFPELGGPTLVRSLALGYASADQDVVSLLTTVTVTGHGQDGATRALPELRLDYQPWRVADEPLLLPPDVALVGEWVDLDGDGVPGLLDRRAGAWHYRSNLSPLGLLDPSEPVIRFADPVVVSPGTPAGIPLAPTTAAAATGATTGASTGTEPGVFADVDGDGLADLLVLDGPAPGVARRDGSGPARPLRPFTPFRTAPKAPPDVAVRALADLTGDGRVDLLVAAGAVASWHEGLGADGFAPAAPAAPGTAPMLLHRDADRLVLLADLDGDGLVDLVEVTRTSVTYRPSLGRGRFGPRVVMADPPVLDAPDAFDPTRVLLVDVDGSGPADLLYLGATGATVWRNRSGDGWGPAILLPGVPGADRMSSVTAVDVLGRGTPALVWTTTDPRPGAAVRCLDLATGGKPHLLSGYDNGFGLEVRLTYTPSTAFALADAAAGEPWPSRMPFAMHCLSRVLTRDRLRRTEFTTRRSYHLGHYDGLEREFAGFGRIDTLDTEQLTGGPDDLPAVLVRTWFHTGASGAVGDGVLAAQRAGFADVPGLDLPFPQPQGATAEDQRHAARALAGLELRSEVHAPDPDAPDPLALRLVRASARTVTTTVLQPGAARRPGDRPASAAAEAEAAVVQVLPLADAETAVEGDPSDARTSETVVLETDELGLVTAEVTVLRPRAAAALDAPPDILAAQRRLTVTAMRREYTGDVLGDDVRRLRAPFRETGVELTRWPGDVDLAAGALPHRDLVLAALGAGGTQVDPDTDPDSLGVPGTGVVRRLLRRQESEFLAADLQSVLPLGQQAGHGVAAGSFELAFTAPMVSARFGADAGLADLAAAGLVQRDGGWWAPSGHDEYPADAPARFLRPQASVDAAGVRTSVEWLHDLLAAVVTDARGHSTVAEFDLRVPAPRLVTDPNGNRTAVRFDPLGAVVATAELGRAGHAEGDTLDDPTTRTEYDFDRWRTAGLPALTRGFARERHGHPPVWQETRTYLDGLARPLMLKTQAAPGLAGHWNEASGTLTEVDTGAAPRWIGTGRTVLNNKGLPVRAYEPFYSDTAEFESAAALVEAGVSDVVRYDALGRARRVEHPDGTFATVTLTAWRVESRDAVDTVLDSAWYLERGSPDPAGAEPAPGPARAAWVAARNADTPVVHHLDVLGRLIGADVGVGGGQVRSSRTLSDVAAIRTTIRDHRGRAVLITLTDLLGRPVVLDDAERGRTVLLTDVLDLPVLSVDGLGRRFTIGVDDLHRAVRVVCTEPAGAGVLLHRVQYGDDPRAGEDQAAASARARAINAVGRLVEMLDGCGRVGIEGYDVDGNATGAVRRFVLRSIAAVDWSAADAAADPDAAVEAMLDPQEWTTSAQHDALGRTERMRLPDDTLLVPHYDAGNRLSGLGVVVGGVGAEQAMLTAQEHDALGRPLTRTLGNGVTTTYAYDPRGRRLTRLTTGAAAGPVLQDLGYQYDPAGNVTDVGDGAQQTAFFANAVVGPGRSYTVDPLGQLVRATGRELTALAMPAGPDAPVVSLPHVNDTTAVRRYTETFEYDDLGNLTTVRHVAGAAGWTRSYRYAYQDDPSTRGNRLMATSAAGDPPGVLSHAYGYDLLGNLITLPQVAGLSWDVLGRLAGADLGGGGSVRYDHDFGGARGRKLLTRNDAVVETLYLGALRVTREWHGAVLARERRTVHVQGDGARIAQLDTVSVNGGGNAPAAPVLRFVHGDLLGSAVLSTDEHGHAVLYEEYHPYGSTAYRSAGPGEDVSLRRFRMLDRERDDETGLYHFDARQYAPWLGRFVSPDPAGLVDGLNTYAYARNNPVTLHDPGGTDSTKRQNFRLPKHLRGKDVKAEDVEKYFRAKGFDFTGPVTQDANGNWDVGTWTKVLGGKADAKASAGKKDDDAAAGKTKPTKGPDAKEPGGDAKIPKPRTSPENDASGAKGEQGGEKGDKGGTGAQPADKPKDEAPGRTTGNGALTTHDSGKRMDYIEKAKQASKEGLDKLKTTPGGEELKLAEQVSNERAALRTATQGELSPGGRALSQAVDTGQGFTESASKYKGRLPSVEGGTRIAAETDAELARRIIVGAGETRGSIKMLAKVGRVGGPLMLAVGIGLGIWAVYDAPPGQRGRVGAREVGAFFGGLAGASVGMSAGVATAGFISGLLMGLGIISGPIGWLAIGLGILVGGAVAWWWSKRAGQAAEIAYDAVAN